MATQGTCLSVSEYGPKRSDAYHLTEPVNYQPNFYYYMITLKNNANPTTERGFTLVRTLDELMVKIMRLTKSAEIKSAYELDTHQQLHVHTLVYTKKVINPIWLNKYIKRDNPEYSSYMINTQLIQDGYHLQNCERYLDPEQNETVIAKYNFFAPSELATFKD